MQTRTLVPYTPASSLGVIVLIASLCSGCGPSDADRALDLLPIIEEGELLPAGRVAELAKAKPDGELAGWLGKAYWRPLPVVPVDGWGRATELGWRPQGERSTLRYTPRLEVPLQAELFVDFHRRELEPDERQPERGRLPADARQTVEIVWDGAPLGTMDLPVGRSRGRFPLPGLAADAASGFEAAFLFDPPLEQAEAGAHSVALERFGLVAAGAEPQADAVRSKIDRETERLQLSGAGTFVTSLHLPADAESLRFDLRLHGDDGGLRLLAVTDDGARRDLLEVSADKDGDWRSVGVSAEALRPLAGRRIVLAAELTGSEPAEIRSPRLVLGREPRPTEPTNESEPASPPVSPPDVVVILIDAARGDRVANPGHPRQATPNIDRLAEDALVFRRAYSECASTACSIPNLITGLPFLDAGIGRGRSLDDRAVTLAETLKTAGYRTVAFSANPKNSPGRNLHQGFDEFHKLWGRNVEDHGPYGMSRRAIEVLESHERRSDGPLYLQLHYLPPHEPYRPQPEFDVFGEPSYDGPIEPGTPPGPYRRGRGALTDADVRRFVDLYDGNYLMVDDAVSQVFDALRATGRWDDTLLLVISDHGEAFWEHGEQGHNTTLFEEMIHIPFVLRLPGTMRDVDLDVDVDRIVFLGDVVPTVLGRLGLETPAGVTGVDLFAPGDAVGPPRLVFRTGNRTSPTFAVRTPSHKLIVRPMTQEQYLFDLRRDPGETKNLLAEHPYLYAGLALQLRRHIEASAALDFDAQDALVSEEDEEVLRSLGYL